jgi:imidazolonepropionase-like amidohydrolase
VLDGWGDGRLDRLVDQQVVLSPTLAVTEVALPADAHARLRERAVEAHGAGVTLVAGSDAGVPGVAYGAGLVRELELLVISGLTPREALRAATSDAARALRVPDIGVVAPDHAADLVVVAGRPDRDLADLRRIRLVLRDGRLVVDHRTA